MASGITNLSASEIRRFAVCPVECPKLRQKITSLADYFSVISSTVSTDDPFWFRGHSEAQWSLTPSALRYRLMADRTKALELMTEFKRIAEAKLSRPPSPDDELKWAQIAQHYGLPTRLLDWTESATAALYFACLRPASDGMVFVLNPVDLNRMSYPLKPRILDSQRDRTLILRYLTTGPRASSSRNYPLAMNPVWNSERLIIQKGVFTIHGTRFSLDKGRVPSLVGVPVLRDVKPRLRSELQRIGVDEMTLFPEIEHSCSHLKRRCGLMEAN
jgi:hypothetical protein